MREVRWARVSVRGKGTRLCEGHCWEIEGIREGGEEIGGSKRAGRSKPQ